MRTNQYQSCANKDTKEFYVKIVILLMECNFRDPAPPHVENVLKGLKIFFESLDYLSFSSHGFSF